MKKIKRVIQIYILLSFHLLFANAGDLVWKFKTDIYPDSRTILVISDTFQGERYLYVSDVGSIGFPWKLHALNSATGIEEWNFTEEQSHYKGQISYYGDIISIIGDYWDNNQSAFGRIWAINARNGSLKWRYSYDKPNTYFEGGVLVYKDRIYSACSGHLYAFNAENGEIIWDKTDMGNLYNSPSISESDDLLFACTDYGETGIWLKNGNMKWSTYDAGGFPVYQNGVLYFGCPITALKSSTGELLYRVEYSTTRAIIHKNNLYAGDEDRYAYCGNIKNGEMIWKSFLGEAVRSTPCAGNETVYFANDFGYLYALNANTGEWKWVFKTEDKIDMDLCIGDSLVYAISRDGYLYAVSLGETIGFKEKQTSHHLPSPSLSAYPNPFKDRLNIEASDKVRVYSLIGQLIMNLSKGKHSIDTSKWREGIYIFKSVSETKRIVKIN